jgi:hypothetical protein
MTDCPELVDVLLTKSVVLSLKENDDLFEEFIITDQYEIKPSRYGNLGRSDLSVAMVFIDYMYICSVPKEKANKRITFTFRIPPMENMKKLGKLHEFIFQLMDMVGGVISLRGEVCK